MALFMHMNAIVARTNPQEKEKSPANWRDSRVPFYSAVFGVLMVLGYHVGYSAAPDPISVNATQQQVNSLIQSGKSLYRKRQYQEALKTYNEALSYETEHESPDLVAEIHFRIAKVYDKQQQHSDALKHYQSALDLYRSTEDLMNVAIVLHNIGGIYFDEGAITQARKMFEEALPIRQKLQDRLGEGRTFVNLGNIHFAQGRYIKALDHYQRAETILREVDRYSNQDVHQDIGAVLTYKGAVYTQLGQYGKAQILHNKARQLYVTVEDQERAALTLHNIGFNWAEQGNLKEAILVYKEALKIHIASNNRLGQADTLNNIGVAYNKMGDYAQALERLTKARELAKASGSDWQLANILDSIGMVYSNLARSELALGYFHESLVFHRKTGNRFGERIVLGNIGLAFEHLGKPRLAITFYKRSVNLTEKIRNELEVLPTAEQRMYLEKVESHYRRLATLLLQQGRVNEAIRVIDLLKIQELESFGRMRVANYDTTLGVPSNKGEWQVTSDNERLIDRDVAVLIELRELEKMEERGALTKVQKERKGQLRQHRAAIRERFKEFYKSEEIKSWWSQLEFNEREKRSTAELMPHPRDLLRLWQGNLAKLSEELGEGIVVFYTLVLESRIELVVVSNFGPPIRVSSPIQISELARLIVELHDGLSNKVELARLKHTAARLYELLIEPIKFYLKQIDARTIIFLPDHLLRYVPLPALYDRVTNTWLTEQYRVFNITAWTLNSDALRITENIDMRVFAGAFTEDMKLDVDGELKTFLGLAGAEREVVELTQMADLAYMLFGKKFSKSATKRRVHEENYSIIHLATHAGIDSEIGKSYILFGDGKELAQEELKEWDLEGVELVVLSACETAVSPSVDGREILSFGHSFADIGAQATIASLWKVNDEATWVLMRSFYHYLRKGAGKSEALRQAQLDLIKGSFGDANESNRGVKIWCGGECISKLGSDFRHPHFWAPFILIGNGL